MSTKAQFTAGLRVAIGQGTANDTVLPLWIQETLNDLENANTFVWMRRSDDFAIAPGPTANEVTLPWTAIKAVNLVRFGVTQGVGSQATLTFGQELQKVNKNQLASIVGGYGGYYYMDGADKLVMDGRPTEAATLYVDAHVFSDWASYDDDDMPPILARHEAAFKAACMMTAAANLRDATLAQIWTGVRDARVPAMVAADTDFEWLGRGRLRMGMNSRGA